MVIMIFDTSYLIEHPEAINNITGDLVIPAIVLKQLDGLKNSEKEDVAQRARAASNAIVEAQRKNRLKIVSEYSKIDMLESHADNVIVGTAMKMKETYSEVVLLTTDTNMKIAAESVGVSVGAEGADRRMDSIWLLRPAGWKPSLIFILWALSQIWVINHISGWVAWLVSLCLFFMGLILVEYFKPFKRPTGIMDGYVDWQLDPTYCGVKGNIFHQPKD